MDLEKELRQIFYNDSQLGYYIHKKLKDQFNPDGFCSGAGYCSHCLTYDELFPKPTPNKEPVEGVDYTKDENDIITLNGSKPLTGTYAHNIIQERLSKIPGFISAERGFKCEEDGILELGFIDLEITDTRNGRKKEIPVDIKGCGANTFYYAAGARNRNPWTYTFYKVKNAIIQTNEYALGRDFSILWVNLESWGMFKLEDFTYDPAMHEMVIRKRKNIKRALEQTKKVRDGLIDLPRNSIILPQFEGNCYCELGKKGDQCYCRHYKTGTTGSFPQISGANCPGKTKLQQALENQDLLELAKEFKGEY
jgi:hypothetical protein